MHEMYLSFFFFVFNCMSFFFFVLFLLGQFKMLAHCVYLCFTFFFVSFFFLSLCASIVAQGVTRRCLFYLFFVVGSV